ncbi:MAG: ligase-associated DNA damage response endonuclease PdeM [Cyanobacteria bacterium P01_F01_bin.53]
MAALLANEIELFGLRLQLLDDKALYLPDEAALLVSDVHLGKAETFQSLGIPIASQVNEENVERLRSLITQTKPQKLFVLGDLFHSRKSLVPEVIVIWDTFLKSLSAEVCLIVGNHDRQLVSALPPMAMACRTEAVQLGPFLLSHEPEGQHGATLNICGHIHPVVRLRSRTDSLRLPCFFVERDQKRLTLPSFGEFTGGYEVKLEGNDCAYVACEGEAVAFEARS